MQKQTGILKMQLKYRVILTANLLTDKEQCFNLKVQRFALKKKTTEVLQK